MNKATKKGRKGTKPTRSTVSQQLFAAVMAAMEAGWSVNAIAHETGVPQSTLQEWVSGVREGINQRTANALAAWLQMRLTEPVIPDLD